MAVAAVEQAATVAASAETLCVEDVSIPDIEVDSARDQKDVQQAPPRPPCLASALEPMLMLCVILRARWFLRPIDNPKRTP